MLRFSKKADYAILLLSHLARSGGEKLRSAQDLAAATGLSPSLTANILKAYARSGILASVRGANGGYRLARDEDGLSLREILEVVEGPLNLVDCSDDEARDNEACCHAEICPSRRPLQALQQRVFELLEQTVLRDLTSPKSACLAADIPLPVTPDNAAPSQV